MTSSGPFRENTKCFPQSTLESCFARLRMAPSSCQRTMRSISVSTKMLPPTNTTLRQLCDGLAEEYPDAASDEIMADVKELLQLLREQGLVLDAA